MIPQCHAKFSQLSDPQHDQSVTQKRQTQRAENTRQEQHKSQAAEPQLSPKLNRGVASAKYLTSLVFVLKFDTLYVFNYMSLSMKIATLLRIFGLYGLGLNLKSEGTTSFCFCEVYPDSHVCFKNTGVYINFVSQY